MEHAFKVAASEDQDPIQAFTPNYGLALLTVRHELRRWVETQYLLDRVLVEGRLGHESRELIGRLEEGVYAVGDQVRGRLEARERRTLELICAGIPATGRCRPSTGSGDDRGDPGHREVAPETEA